MSIPVFTWEGFGFWLSLSFFFLGKTSLKFVICQMGIIEPVI